MEYKDIILEKEGGVAIVTLNRPERLNAISYQLGSELEAVIGEVDKDAEARVLVITGAGRAFCSGVDLRGERMAISEEVPQGRLLYQFQRIILALTHLGKPSVAMVNGTAIGFGCDIALACDLRMGSPEASFSTGFIRFGGAHVTGGTWLLPRIVGVGKALEYLLMGDFCNGEEAYRIGLLNRTYTVTYLGSLRGHTDRHTLTYQVRKPYKGKRSCV